MSIIVSRGDLYYIVKLFNYPYFVWFISPLEWLYHLDDTVVW